MELPSLSLSEVREELRTGNVSPLEVLNALEERIARVDPDALAQAARA